MGITSAIGFKVREVGKDGKDGKDGKVGNDWKTGTGEDVPAVLTGDNP
jgi:hypothetical protein